MRCSLSCASWNHYLSCCDRLNSDFVRPLNSWTSSSSCMTVTWGLLMTSLLRCCELMKCNCLRHCKPLTAWVRADYQPRKLIPFTNVHPSFKRSENSHRLYSALENNFLGFLAEPVIGLMNRDFTASASECRLRADCPSTSSSLQINMRCYFNVCSKANMSQLNLLHGTNN